MSFREGFENYKSMVFQEACSFEINDQLWWIWFFYCMFTKYFELLSSEKIILTEMLDTLVRQGHIKGYKFHSP